MVATTESGDPTSALDRRPGAGADSAPQLGRAARRPQVQRQNPQRRRPAKAPPAAASRSGSSATAYEAPLRAAGTGPYASQAGRREIERSAEIVLGAEPAEVRADAAKVFDAVHAADGIVLSSSIRDGEAGEAGADFELLIPSGKLGDALASFSAIAEVRSRHEATQDITAPTVGVGERLQDARATVEGLLDQLAGAETDEERAAVEAELRAERRRSRRCARASPRWSAAPTSRGSRCGSRPAPPLASDEGGAWGIGDGIDGAGRILAVAAGVTVIGLAILAPFALIVLLAWLARRAWLRRARRDALHVPEPESDTTLSSGTSRIGWAGEHGGRASARTGRGAQPGRRPPSRARPPRSCSCAAAASTGTGRSRCCC